MKNRLLLSLLICLSFNDAGAQLEDTSIAAVVRYQLTYIIDTSFPNNPQEDEMVLLIGKKSSIYLSKSMIDFNTRLTAYFQKNPEMLHKTAQTVFWAEPYCFEVNKLKSQIISQTLLNGIYYLVDEQIPDINWTITDSSKQIGSFLCQKAMTHFRGRDYEAWFTTQLPFTTGPWKLNGLPGLILEAQDQKREWIIRFKSFDNGNNTAETPLKLVNLGYPEKNISAKELKNLVTAYRNDPIAFSGASSLRTMVMTDANSTPGIKRTKKEFNNPLEKNE